MTPARAADAPAGPRAPPPSVDPARNQRTFRPRVPPPPTAGRSRLARVDRYEGTVVASHDYLDYVATGGAAAAKTGDGSPPGPEEGDQVAAIVQYLREKREEQKARQAAKAAARGPKPPGGAAGVRLLDKARAAARSKGARKAKREGRGMRSSAPPSRGGGSVNSGVASADAPAKRRNKERKERKKKKERAAAPTGEPRRTSGGRRAGGRAPSGGPKGGPAPRKEGLSFSAALRGGAAVATPPRGIKIAVRRSGDAVAVAPKT